MNPFRFDVVTLFPKMIEAFAAETIIRKGIDAGLIEVAAQDLRSYASDRHRTTDDAPFGGGAGMVMRIEPLAGAIDAAKKMNPGAPVVLLTPRGQPFQQSAAEALAQRSGLVLVCGRYEGVDERVATLVECEISLGDFLLSGGEAAAFCILDAVARLIPGVIGNAASLDQESFQGGILEYPQYTRPASWEGQDVPPVLMGGNHLRIARWRRRRALLDTRERRPDLFARVAVSESDLKLIATPEEAL